jgi:hypothetical protein
MGQSITPAYRVEVTVEGSYWTPARWDAKHFGRPNDGALVDYVEQVEASTREGGVNAHLGATVIRSAKVIRQADNEVVARYHRAS